MKKPSEYRFMHGALYRYENGAYRLCFNRASITTKRAAIREYENYQLEQCELNERESANWRSLGDALQD